MTESTYVTSETQQRPKLLLLSAGFWLISGVAGLALILPNIPIIWRMPTWVLLFAIASVLSHILSLWGSYLLYRFRKSAIVVLLPVFILSIGVRFFKSSTPLDWSMFAITLWSIAAFTIAYSLQLQKRGILK